MADAVYTGTVRSFLFSKGYGFIGCDQVAEGDVYFKKSSMPQEYHNLQDDNFFKLSGRTVSFEVQLTQDGKPQGKNVRIVAAAGEEALGEIKSFNSEKGFGFIGCTSLGSDAYFQKKDIPFHWQGAHDLMGQKVKFVLFLTQDGKNQAKSINIPGVTQQNMGMGMQTQRMQQAPAPMMGSPQVSRGGTVRLNSGGNTRMAAPMQQFSSAPMSAPQPQVAEGKVLVGSVKSFISDKGYGFITSPEFSGDVYFKGDGQFQQGAQVCFMLQYSSDGKARASNIQAAFAEGERQVGYIVSFVTQKGFGFLTVPDRLQDVYFQAKDLPSELQDAASLIGAEVQFTVALTSDGKPQMRDADFVSPPTGTAPPRAAAAKRNETSATTVKRPAPSIIGNDSSAAKRQRLPPPPPPFTGYSATPAPSKAPQASRAHGVVKRFDMAKGYGFISSPSTSTDVFFQKGQLPQQYQESDVTGMEVSFNLRYTADGKPQGGSLEVSN